MGLSPLFSYIPKVAMEENKGLTLTSMVGSKFADVDKERRLQIRR